MTLLDSIAKAQLGEPRAQQDGSVLQEFCFGPDDPTFAGHFPGQPVLPGVFQLEMVRVTAERFLQCSLQIREVVRAKFTRPILPGEKVRLELKLIQDNPLEARAGLSVGDRRAGEIILRLCRSA